MHVSPNRARDSDDCDELCALRWRDVDLAGGWLHVGETKTDAGRRSVKIRGALRDEMLSLRGRHQDVAQSAYVFPTTTGGKQSQDNFRSRVLGKPADVKAGGQVPGKGVIAAANTQLEANGLPPLPKRLTPHSLRRTICSLLYALGEDPGTHGRNGPHRPGARAPRLPLGERRGEREKAQLRALLEGEEVACRVPVPAPG